MVCDTKKYRQNSREKNTAFCHCQALKGFRAATLSSSWLSLSLKDCLVFTFWGSWRDLSGRWWTWRTRRSPCSAEPETSGLHGTTFSLKQLPIYRYSFSRGLFLAACFNLSLLPKFGYHLKKKCFILNCKDDSQLIWTLLVESNNKVHNCRKPLLN